MKTTDILKIGVALFTAITLSACGDDSSSSPDDSYSSVASFKSSSSLSTRADIDYKDTVSIGSTMRVYLKISKGDSADTDTNVTFIDEDATSLPLYIGELPKGSRIKIYASTFDIKDEKIRIKNEQGRYMPALTGIPKEPIPKNSKVCGGSDTTKVDSIYSNYFRPTFGCFADSTFKDSNQFVIFSDDHYYLEIDGEFSNKSSLRLKAIVDTAYYNYTGDEENISMKMSDTIRGIIAIDKAPDEIDVNFSANEGYSVNLLVKGQNINSYKLTDGQKELGSSRTNIDTMLVPTDAVNWTVKIKPVTLSIAPFAFFETITRARALEQGEYFSYPDSISYPGKTFIRTRPKDDPGKAIYKYNLRQEQFVWIGDYKKGDSVIVNHEISNYSIDPPSTVKCEILDKDQKVQATISSTYGGAFSIKGDMPEGPYYLHYLRLNSEPLDQVYDSLRYVLQLYTTVKVPGLLKEFEFYDIEKNTTYTQKFYTVGDTIHFNKFAFQMKAADKASWGSPNSETETSIIWFVPCAMLDYINVDYKRSDCEEYSSRNNKNAEQEISSTFLIAQEAGINETAELIAQSEADPSMRDTLKIEIIGKVD